jgi:hypothetical protein
VAALSSSQTRTARHKIAKFLRQHAALAVSKGMAPPGGSAMLSSGGDAGSGTCGSTAAGTPADADARQVTWMVIQCEDRPGLLAEVANVIARHQHNITVRRRARFCGRCAAPTSPLVSTGCFMRIMLSPVVKAVARSLHAKVDSCPLSLRHRVPAGKVADPACIFKPPPPPPALSARPPQAYSGSADPEAGLFVMEYELEGGLRALSATFLFLFFLFVWPATLCGDYFIRVASLGFLGLFCCVCLRQMVVGGAPAPAPAPPWVTCCCRSALHPLLSQHSSPSPNPQCPALTQLPPLPPPTPAGRPSTLQTLCEELSCIESVSSWASGCALPEAQLPRRRI